MARRKMRPPASTSKPILNAFPYNKDYTKWWHRLGQRLAGTRLRGLMLALDTRLGYGERLKPKAWWEGEKESIVGRRRRCLVQKKD